MKKLFRAAILAALLAVVISAGPAAAEKARPRIISLYAAHTEVLLRLGARDNIIGVSAQETYQGPETEGWQPRIYSIRDDVEKILAARPDLVLVRPMHMASASVETLKASGVKVRALQVVRAGDLYQYWRDLAAIVGKEAEAERMIADFDSRVSLYHQAASRRAEEAKPGIFLEAMHNQIKTFTPDSLPVWLLELAGGRNVAADAKAHAKNMFVTNYGPERLLAKADEVDIYIAQLGPMNSIPLSRIKKREIFKVLKAFKDGRVYQIPEDILSRPTPSLLEGLAELAELTGLAAEMAAENGGADENLTVGLPPESK
ncbi:ABC transporter substrate-binding protein [Deltaproteobacteria bacterium OttesenSCG-928-K17]|nr:ABC transporter substrate-binding protein [Deltaproteobacteria bacterium OttesenSCG-928-K17]